MPFLPPDQQRQNTEDSNWLFTTYPLGFLPPAVSKENNWHIFLQAIHLKNHPQASNFLNFMYTGITVPIIK